MGDRRESGRWCGAWSRWLLRGPSPSALRLLGVVLGAVGLKDVLWSMVAYNALAHPGRFYWPYVDLPRVPYEGALGWLPAAFQTAATFSSLALIAGVASRASALVLLSCYAYSFLGDRLAYTNNLYVFQVFLALFALGSGRDPRAARAAGRALQLFVVSIYLTGGLTKLTPTWLSGAILREALYYYQNVYQRLINWDSPAAFQAMAWGTVAAELFLALGLWHRRTRPWAMAVGVSLHAGIEVLIPVRMFSYLMIGSYLLFADDGAARRLDQAARSHPAWLRALGGLGAIWLLNRFFARVTGNYEYTLLADTPLLVSLPALALLAHALGPAAPPHPARTRAWPLLRAALPLCLAIHAALLLKPAFGRPTDFSFRIFTELVLLRVEMHVRHEGQWFSHPLYGATHRWSDEHGQYTWGSWSDERPVLEAYARWIAARIQDVDAVRVEAHATRNLHERIVERWEVPVPPKN